MMTNNNVRLLAENITVSNDTKVTGLNNNDLIIGSSGSGKTGGYVIPNIQNISGSLVVTDTKGRLSKMFSNTLKRKGYKVYTLDFVNPMNSCGYNPLRAIRRKPNGKYREQDILSLATAITPILDKDEPFWEKAASGYIASLIAFCLETCGVQDRNLKTVCELHHIFIIDTFLDTYDLSGKTVMPFCTSGSSGISASVSDIRAQEPDADVREGFRAEDSSDNGIDKWINKNSLL